jgi:DNA-binding CsgD family transcriptional regulator
VLDETSAQGLIERIYEAAIEPEGWEAFLDSLGTALGGAALLLTIESPSRRGPGTAVTHGIDPAFKEQFDKYYSRICPWVEGGVPAEGKVHLSRIPERDLASTEFYADWMRPQGLLPGPIIDGTVHATRDGSHSAIFGGPPKGGRLLGEAELELCQSLMPHLQRAIRVTQRLSTLEAGGRAGDAMLERLPIGAALVNAEGQVVWANHALEAMLEEKDGLAIRRDGLHGMTAADTRALQISVAEAAATGAGANPGGESQISLARPSGRLSHTALVFPIPHKPGELFDSKPAVGILVTDPERQITLEPKLLQRLYSLTPAEAQLTALLVEGKRLEEAATELGIRFNTARHQLRHVFAKTGTDRQASLLRLILTGPASLLGATRNPSR